MQQEHDVGGPRRTESSWPAWREVKPDTERNVKGAGTEDGIGNGGTRASFSVTLFHMVEPLFKRPITL